MHPNTNMKQFRSYPPTKIRNDMRQMVKYRWFHGRLQGLQSMERLNRTVRNRQHTKNVWLRFPDSRLDQITAISKKLTGAQTMTIDLTAYVQGHGFLIVDSNRVLESERVLNLCRNLQKFRFLKSLNITASHCDRVTDRGLLRINDTFHMLNKLDEVSLNLHNSEASDKVMMSLARKLAHKPSLNLFHLNLMHCSNISDESLIAMSQELPKINQLQVLELRIQECSKLTRKGFLALAASISSISTLQQLSLNLGKSTAVNDNVLVALGESLTKSPHLRKLDLNFHTCPLVRDKGLTALTIGISALRRLVHLTVAFNYCDLLTDESVKLLCHSISRLTVLQELQLEFENCSRLSDESIITLKGDIGSLKRLEKIQLEFRRCDWISEEGYKLIKSLEKRDNSAVGILRQDPVLDQLVLS